MKKRMFTVAAFQMALFFWVIESAIHFFVFEEAQFEFIPSEMNELWMRVVIVFLIMLLGVFADALIDRMVHKQMEVAHTYNSLIQAGNQTLENLVHQMQLFKAEAQRSADFDQDVLKYYDNSIDQASDLIDRFTNVDKALNGSAPSDETEDK